MHFRASRRARTAAARTWARRPPARGGRPRAARDPRKTAPRRPRRSAWPISASLSHGTRKRRPPDPARAARLGPCLPRRSIRSSLSCDGSWPHGRGRCSLRRGPLVTQNGPARASTIAVVSDFTDHRTQRPISPRQRTGDRQASSPALIDSVYPRPWSARQRFDGRRAHLAEDVSLDRPSDYDPVIHSALQPDVFRDRFHGGGAGDGAGQPSNVLPNLRVRAARGTIAVFWMEFIPRARRCDNGSTHQFCRPIWTPLTILDGVCADGGDPRHRDGPPGSQAER